MASFSSSYSGEDVRELMELEKKSAAVETLFTVALVLFAQGQLTATLYSQNMSVPEIGLMAGGIFMGLGVIGAALLISGDNLVGVWRREMPQYDDEWTYLD